MTNETVKRVYLKGTAPYKASALPLMVVAAKKPFGWIIRGYSPSMGWQEIVNKMLPIVGSLDPEIEWTGYRYDGWPFYAVPAQQWPHGIFMFKQKPFEPSYSGASWFEDYHTEPIQMGDTW